MTATIVKLGLNHGPLSEMQEEPTVELPMHLPRVEELDGQLETIPNPTTGNDILLPNGVSSDSSSLPQRNGRVVLDEGYYYLAFAYAIGLGPSLPTPTSIPVGLTVQDTDTTIPTVDVAAWGTLACAQGFTWSCAWVLETIDCESTGRPAVVGHEVIGGIDYYFYGLLQIYHPDPPGVSNEYLLQPYLNLAEGHIQYAQWQRGERPNPWPNCP